MTTIQTLFLTALCGPALLAGSASAAVLLATDFEGSPRSVTENTLENITYMTLNGVSDPGDLTAVEGNEEAPANLLGLFNAAVNSSQFAPRLNTDNQDTWTVVVPLNLTGSALTIDDVVLVGDMVNSGGTSQGANLRDTDMFVSIAGSSSGVVATETLDTGLVSQDWSLTFFNASAPIALTASETWTMTVGTTNFDNIGGNNTALDSLTVNGSVAIPEPSSTALLGLAGLAQLRRRRR